MSKPVFRIETDNSGTFVTVTHVDMGVAVKAQISPVVSTGNPAAARTMLRRARRLYSAGYTGSEIFKKLS